MIDKGVKVGPVFTGPGFGSSGRISSGSTRGNEDRAGGVIYTYIYIANL